MSIAQRFVAGEGVAHPFEAVDLAPQPPLVEPPSQTAIALADDSVNLPWRILRAIHRAHHLAGLPDRARTLLAALARTVDARQPQAAIFARRELLTGRAMQSMRTFYRSLDDLEAAGLIARPPQRRYGQAGLFGRAYLHLTDPAVTLLGFVDEEAATPTSATSAITPAVAPAVAPPRHADTPVTSDEPESHAVPGSIDQHDAPADPRLSFSDRSATVADRAIYKDLFPTPKQKRQPGQPPADLQRLRALGFHDFLIFRLMREAREHGKRLSDVVEATWQHLKKAVSPVSYLRSLLRSTTDFGYIARQREVAHEARMVDIAADEAARRFAQQAAGQTYLSQDEQTLFAVGNDAASLTIYRVQDRVPRLAGASWRRDLADAVSNGRIRIAHAEEVVAFHAETAASGEPRRRAEKLSSLSLHRRTPDFASVSHPPQAPRVLTATASAQLLTLRSMLGPLAARLTAGPGSGPRPTIQPSAPTFGMSKKGAV